MPTNTMAILTNADVKQLMELTNSLQILVTNVVTNMLTNAYKWLQINV
jgi:hypothetical protein